VTFTDVPGFASVSEDRGETTLVVETAQTSELLRDVSEIFLESCVELESMPRAGFVAHVALEQGESLASISTTLPVVRPVDTHLRRNFH